MSAGSGQAPPAPSEDERRHHPLNQLRVGYQLSEGRYELIHRNGNVEPRDEPAEPIASGGAGQVFRGTNDLGLNYAIKVLNPAIDLLKDGSGPFHETFDREIKMLAKITHTRLAKIVDVGRIEAEDGTAVPFYVMDFIRGTPFQDYIENTELSGLDFLQLVDQVLEAVEYLHARWIMHCDLKSTNILVGDDEALNQGVAQATVVDLGVAKVVKDPAEDEEHGDSGDEADSLLADFEADVPDAAKTYFVSSESITRAEWRPYLNKSIPRQALRRRLFPYHDLYGIGILVTNALASEGLEQRLSEEVGESGLEALRELANRLTEPEDGERYYQTVEQLRRDWQKLDPRYLAPVGIPELAIGAQAKTAVATPSGRVSLTARTLDLINHPAFQRMRLVPQLELVSLVYPGATHTRLLHSLSTFDMARRCVLHLLRDPTFRLMVDQEQIEATLLTALCHDIGHYPLSHMFEDFAEEERQAGGERVTPSDDDLFYAFLDPGSLDERWEPFARAATETLEAHPGDAGTLYSLLFESGRFSPRVLEAMHALERCESPSAQILRGLITSPVDADKLSYLSDDSAMTGVRYGLGIDIDAFLSSLRAPSRADLEKVGGSGKPLVAINDKGLPAAEGVILSRYWMLKRVYWHHTNRAAIAMTKYVIAELRRQRKLNMVDYFRETMFGTVQEALSLLSGRFDSYASEHVNPLHGLASGGRWLYKRIMTFAKEDPDEGNKERYELMARIPSGKVIEITDLAREVFKGPAGREIEPGEILLDVPIKQREFIGSPLLVYPHREPDRGRVIKDASPLVNSHAVEFDVHVKKCRVFIHPNLFDDLGDGLDEARKSFEAALDERFA